MNIAGGHPFTAPAGNLCRRHISSGGGRRRSVTPSVASGSRIPGNVPPSLGEEEGCPGRLSINGAACRVYDGADPAEGVLAEMDGDAIWVVDRGGIRRAGAGEAVARCRQAVGVVGQPFLAVSDQLIIWRGRSLHDLIAGYDGCAAIGQVDRKLLEPALQPSEALAAPSYS